MRSWADLNLTGFRTSFVSRSQLNRTEIFAVCVLVALVLTAGLCHRSSVRLFGSYDRFDASDSPYAAAADFSKYVTNLCNGAVLRAEPTMKFPGHLRTPWKTNIVTTVFWVGEPAGPNNPVSNIRSSWDLNWTVNYGGNDPPETSNRRDFIPVAFIPRQNPFYVALPYNDLAHGEFKPEAPLMIPWFRRAYTAPGISVCKDRWIAIRKGNRTCYAQWEDCGPFRTDNVRYVFGNERPAPNANNGAGLDVSPAVRDYLGMQSTDVTDWQFVELNDVPQGPWRNYGDNNPFVIASRRAEMQAAARSQTASGEDRPVNAIRSE